MYSSVHIYTQFTMCLCSYHTNSISCWLMLYILTKYATFCLNILFVGCLTSQQHASVSQGRLLKHATLWITAQRIRKEDVDDDDDYDDSIIVIFKCANRISLHSSAANFLKNVSSNGHGAIMCKSRATHRSFLTRKSVLHNLIRRSRSAIKADRVEITYI